MADYTSVRHIELTKRRPLTAAEFGLSADAIATANELVDLVTGRTFTPTNGVKLFDGTGTQNLFIPDLIALAEVQIDDVVEENVVAYELNETPKYCLRRQGGSAWYGVGNTWHEYGDVWPVGQANISVSGRWGYAEDVPAGIIRAATLIAMDILWPTGGDDAGAPGVTSEKWPDYAVTYASRVQNWGDLAELSPGAARALRRYTRMELNVV